MKKGFLLGGHDLEMSTIKEILINEGGIEFEKISKEDDAPIPNIIIIDKKLRWDNAKLSEYRGVLESYADSEQYKIYGIELIDDSENKKFDVPHNYIRVDHHNDLCWNPSSLEQVAKLLDIELTFEQELIAANDRGYIPEMCQCEGAKGEKATLELIKEIRTRDKEACGITKKDEKKAKKIYDAKDNKDNIENINCLTVINANGARFGALSDIHFFEKNPDPTEKCAPLNYLIYNEKELCFYGTASAVSYFAEMHGDDLEAKKMYRGRGFLGTDKECEPKKREKLLSEIKKSFENIKTMCKIYTEVKKVAKMENKDPQTALTHMVKDVIVIKTGFSATKFAFADFFYIYKPKAKKYNIISHNKDYTEVAFIGNPTVASALASIFCKKSNDPKKEEGVEYYYHRGKGFFGISGFGGTKKGFDELVELIRNLVKNYAVLLDSEQNQSYHIFFYPFRWQTSKEDNLTFEERIELEKIELDGKGDYRFCKCNPCTLLWTGVQDDESQKKQDYDSHVLYNEKTTSTISATICFTIRQKTKAIIL